MILKIIGYGDPMLRKQSVVIGKNYPCLPELIANMFETMKAANGVGLAAPQIGLNIKLIVVDSNEIKDNKQGITKAFINPIILEYSGEKYDYEEGCLSIPNIHEDVSREEKILIRYQDENFKTFEEYYDSYNARVLQHECDHLFGKLFIDRISLLKKRLIKRKLNDIITGDVEVNYPMKFYQKSKKR